MNFVPVSTIPDVSFYQDDNSTPQGIDFQKMRTQTDGVIIRAGQRNWIDPDFIVNRRSARAAGLKRGSYWFYDSRETPQKQADLWKISIGWDLPEWGLWIDLEESYGGAWRGEANWKRFAEAVKDYFPGVTIGIYTASWWWNEQIVRQNDYWKSYPLWVAQYIGSPDNVAVPPPWKEKGAILWQYTDKGNGPQYGVESRNIDLNYTSKAWYQLFGGGPIPPPTEGESVDKYMKVTDAVTQSLNIRTSGENLGSANDLGSFNLLREDVIHVIEVNANNFCRFDTLYRNNVLTPLPVSPTGQYWSLEKDSSGVWLVDTTFTPPDAKSIMVVVDIDGYKPKTFTGELEPE